MPDSILDAPWVQFGRETCGDIEQALRREWLVTNGIGGYASGTIVGVNTRSHHGVLVAALDPPAGRVVLVAGTVAWMNTGDRRVPLTSHEFGDGVIAPEGYRHVESFRLEGTLPVWRFAYRDVLIERRLWMAPGANTTFVRYELLRGAPVSIDIIPLVTRRDPNILTSGLDWQMDVDVRAHEAHGDDGDTEESGASPSPVRMTIDHGEFRPSGEWYWNFQHRAETARGLADRGDCYAPGAFVAALEVGGSATLTFSAEPPSGPDDAPELDADAALEAIRARQRILVDRVRERAPADAPPAVGALAQHLALAADQCFSRCAFSDVRDAGDETNGAADGAAPAAEGAAGPSATDDGARADASGNGWTILAGFPWFLDWGRDAMIALPGLTGATGRTDEAAAVLRAAASSVQDGLVPNAFGVRGQEPLYNSADASLWFIRALDYLTPDPHAQRPTTHALLETRNSQLETLFPDLAPTVRDIIDRFTEGTRHGIGVDPADGLLRAGEPGVQLTWMDAKVDEWVVTPRIGKPVELNALWYLALRTAQRRFAPPPDHPAPGSLDPLAQRATPNAPPDPSTLHPPLSTPFADPAFADPAFTDPAFADRCKAAADRLRESFRARFVSPDRPWLADVVDGPDGDDWSHRPNQVLALALAPDLVDDATADGILAAAGRSLLTSMGLRTLSRDNAAYRGAYGGDHRMRDGAYHQGTVWPWLMGAFLEALHRRTGDRTLILRYLEPFADHLRIAGLGSVSELADGDPPYRPDGATSQAWSIAELYRIWRLVTA